MANETLSLNKKTSGETVTVSCKLPNGLVLRVFRTIEVDVPVMGGGVRKETKNEPLADVYTVHGWSHAQNSAPHCTIIGGYALTGNIPKGHWDLWLSQNKNSAMVKNGLIFAHATVASAKDQAKDGRTVRSGLERLDPNKLPRVGKHKIETDTALMGSEQLGRMSDAESAYV
jgi:hypothetical protein